jgi:hypothetical protein
LASVDLAQLGPFWSLQQLIPSHLDPSSFPASSSLSYTFSPVFALLIFHLMESHLSILFCDYAFGVLKTLYMTHFHKDFSAVLYAFFKTFRLVISDTFWNKFPM